MLEDGEFYPLDIDFCIPHEARGDVFRQYGNDVSNFFPTPLQLHCKLECKMPLSLATIYTAIDCIPKLTDMCLVNVLYWTSLNRHHRG